MEKKKNMKGKKKKSKKEKKKEEEEGGSESVRGRRRDPRVRVTKFTYEWEGDHLSVGRLQNASRIGAKSQSSRR